MNIDRKDPTIGNDNAYRPPAANLEFASRELAGTDLDEAVKVREAHVGHERQLKSVALVYALATLGTLGSGVASMSKGSAEDAAVGVVMLIFSPLCAFLTWAYASLSPMVRWVGTPMAILGLLNPPIGTLISGLVLYLIWCEKGRRVLSPDYAAIIRTTPQVRYKSGKGGRIAPVVLGMLIVVLIALVAFVLLR
jgi:hypothetical protein